MFRAPFRALPVLVAAVLTLAACTGSDAVDQSGAGTFQYASGTALGHLYPQGKRKPAPDFTASLLNGGKLKLSSTKGKVVVLNYWASWCAPCQTETPQFDLLYRKVKDQGVAFVGIDTKDGKSQAQSFISKNDITYPIVYDEPGETAVRLGNLPTANLPFTVLLDKQGKVAAVYVAMLSYKDLQTSLDKLLAER
jgi:peroxiredoxin